MAKWKNYKYKSSNLESAAYNVDTKELIMKFLNGSFYSYENVPLNIVEGIATADSSGKYFYKEIKQGGFSYKKL